MKTPLHKLLTNYIKLHNRVLHSEITRFARELGAKEYTAVRRLQEVRQEKHRNYDPDIGALDRYGKPLVNGNGIIGWYIYKPAFAMNPQANQKKTPSVEQRAVHPEKPRISQNNASSEFCCNDKRIFGTCFRGHTKVEEAGGLF